MRQQPLQLNRAIIPNTVTALSVFLGYLSILYTFDGEYVLASWLIIFAGVFDLMDGRVARVVKVTSKFGGYFDSLADAINYGVAPSLLFFHAYLRDWGAVGALVSFLPTVCGAIRLARFGVLSDESAKGDFFLGLPTTTAAGLLVAYIIFMQEITGHIGASSVAAAMMAAASLLMVSDIPYDHNSSYTRRNWKTILAVGMLATLALFPAKALFPWLAAYVVYGFVRGILWTINDLRRNTN